MRARQRPAGPRVPARAWSPLSPGLPGPFPGEDAGSVCPRCLHSAQRHRKCARLPPYFLSFLRKLYKSLQVPSCLGECWVAAASRARPGSPGQRSTLTAAVFICQTGALGGQSACPLVSRGGGPRRPAALMRCHFPFLILKNTRIPSLACEEFGS